MLKQFSKDSNSQMRLKQAWSCWLKGFLNYRNTAGDGNMSIVKINLFGNIRLKLLQKKIKKSCVTIFSLMDKCLDLRTDQVDIDLYSFFKLAIHYAKQNVE